MSDGLDSVAVKVEGVTKTFVLPHQKPSSMKDKIIHFYKKRNFEKQVALKDVSFEVKKGEFFGIVGRNGSGKSTLLKMLAGIYAPTEGHITVNGQLTPFIELGVGFNPELTGRENVYLNGALLGFSRREMQSLYGDIVKFAELDRFMDQKLKNYSSGMQVRLAFSIAIRANSDILLIDEVLAVGDAAFQQKCYAYFDEIKRQNKTVIFVSHDMEAVKRFCNEGLLLEEGKVKSIGAPAQISNQYSLDNVVSTNTEEAKNKEINPIVKKLKLRAISPLEVSNNDTFEFEISYELSKSIDVDLGISLIYQGQSVIEHNTKELKLGNKKGRLYKIRYKLPLRNFTPKKLGINVALFEKGSFKLLGFNSDSLHFIVKSDKGPKGGLLNSRGEWVVLKETS